MTEPISELEYLEAMHSSIVLYSECAASVKKYIGDGEKFDEVSVPIFWLQYVDGMFSQCVNHLRLAIEHISSQDDAYDKLITTLKAAKPD